MLLDSEDGRHLLNEFAYQLVVENAPQELPLYVTMRDRYLADPRQYLQPAHDPDEAMAFGPVEVVETFTYFVFPLVAPILTYVVAEVKKSLKDDVGQSAVDWVRSLVKKRAQPQPIFTQAQLALIAKEMDYLVEQESRRLGVRKAQAYAVKNAIIGRLALATESNHRRNDEANA